MEHYRFLFLGGTCKALKTEIYISPKKSHEKMFPETLSDNSFHLFEPNNITGI